VTVGPAELLDVTEVVGIRARWHGRDPAGPLDVQAQLRAHGEPVPAVVVADLGAETVCVSLERAVRGVAAGQALVLYDGDRVVASATVDRASASAPLDRAGARR
jgi:tRNA-specific 2-thiouridylase